MAFNQDPATPRAFACCEPQYSNKKCFKEWTQTSENIPSENILQIIWKRGYI